MPIRSRVPADEYGAIAALNISRLKEIKRSPLHYQHRLSHPRESAALSLGTAAHVAVLEPERFEKQFAVWERRTDGGAMAPRRGQHWDAFLTDNPGKTILTQAEAYTARAIQSAIRGNAAAMRYLSTGEPEVTMTWSLNGRPCKGRVDWLTVVDGRPVIVGLKTARDCRHYVFGKQAAQLGYHYQWAWYFDGYIAERGNVPKVIEIVVEAEAPHATAVYRITDDILDQGREEYNRLLATLDECERTGIWPGPVPEEENLSLPSWAYDAADDLSDLELGGTDE